MRDGVCAGRVMLVDADADLGCMMWGCWVVPWWRLLCIPLGVLLAAYVCFGVMQGAWRAVVWMADGGVKLAQYGDADGDDCDCERHVESCCEGAGCRRRVQNGWSVECPWCPFNSSIVGRGLPAPEGWCLVVQVGGVHGWMHYVLQCWTIGRLLAAVGVLEWMLQLHRWCGLVAGAC